MIIAQLKCGLGNQMFQYAFGRSLSLKFDTKLYLDLSFLENRQFWEQYIYRDYGLNIFNVTCNLNGDKKRNIFFPSSYFNKVRKLKESFNHILGYRILEEDKINKDEITNHISKNTYLIGYWQSDFFFKENASVILKDFSFKTSKVENASISEKIKLTDSVSVHIRRGDYVSNEQTMKLHGTCSIEYYKTAIELIMKQVPESEFYFFSDEPEWVKDNIKIPYRNYIINWNKGKDSYEDMRLMSLCKHNIIANSSFSWWGAWLNQNPNKIVIAPAKWFANSEMNNNSHDLIPEKWHRI
jgi:hypothetical protein